MISVIRPLLTGDRNAVKQILDTTSEFTTEEVDVAIELVDIFLGQGHKSGYYCLVYEVDEQVAGYICYGPTPLTQGTWDIYWIAVDVKQQRKGIGRSLLAYAENEIAENKGRLICIETSSREEYVKTRGFYRSMQYEEVASIPDFYTENDGKVIFCKKFQSMEAK